RVFYPFDLSIMYNHPYDSISIRAGLFFIFCIASFLLVVFIYRKKNKLLLFSLLFFLFTIAPYLQLSQIGIQAIADRWCYIAKYGVVLFLFSFSFKSILKKRLHIIIIFLVALVNLYYGLPYASAWKNDISLYEYTLENNYKNNMVYRLLAKSYNHQATKEKNIRKYKEKYLNNLIMSLNENILDIESFHMFLRAIKKNSATHKAKLKEFIDRLFKVSNDSVDNKKYKSIILADLEGNSFAKNYITKNYGVHPLEMANGLLSEAMAKDSKNLELYISYLKVAHYAKIKKAVIKTILKLFPNSQQALFFAGSDAYNTKNFDEAITKLKKYVEIAPNSAESYGMIASSYIEKNDYNNALTYAKYALQSSENHPNMKAIYYDILLKKGKKDKVILEILNDISLNNYNTNTLNILAKIYEGKGLYKKALKLYKLSLKDKKTIESYENIANIYKTLNCKALYNKYRKIARRMKSKIKNQPKESISINVILGMPMN
ncbi:MAG: tetratricopeptide repeat protein, partial [Bdellovibrionota bacterium]